MLVSYFLFGMSICNANQVLTENIKIDIPNNTFSNCLFNN